MDKRYLIFQYDSYYPNGAMNDFKESFDDIKDVQNYIEENKRNYDHYSVYDRISGVVIYDVWTN
jgi:hypothetical protein